MNRNLLYVIIAALAVVVIAFGIYAWREETKPDGVQINIGEDGISIQEN